MKKQIGKVGILCIAVLLILAGCGSGQGAKDANGSKKTEQDVVIYVTRHGKTMLNQEKRVQGFADSPLIDSGTEVAKQLGKGLKGTHFDAVYSSDSGRARETADAILETQGQKHLKLHESKKLREVCFGKYEGDLDANMWGDIAKQLGYPDQPTLMKAISAQRVTIEQSLEKLQKLDDTGMAETYPAVRNRMQQELTKVAKKQADQGGGNVLLVSHGMAIGALISNLTDDYHGEPFENASVTKIRYKHGKFHVESINDMSYVEKGTSKD